MEIKSFQFSTNPELIFGLGAIQQLSSAINDIGSNILLVMGESSFRNTSYYEPVIADLEKNKISYYEVMVAGEPTPTLIDQVVEDFREENIHAVVSIGGGSAIDAGKAISAMLPQKETVFSFLEGVGNKRHNGVKAPFIAVPTTAGTGSEATKNAVLSHIGPDGFKKSLRHKNFIPDLALIDPNLTLSCPPTITAACGLDAFTQLLESYVSKQSTPLTDSLVLDAMRLFQSNLDKSYGSGAQDPSVRASISYGAYISGVSLANTGLGTVHGFASVIGGYFNIPHGSICACLLAETTRMNIARLLEGKPEDQKYLQKYANVGFIMHPESTGSIIEGCEALLRQLDHWNQSLHIPYLSDFALKKSHIDKIVATTENKNNPVELSPKDLAEILTKRIKDN